MDESRNLYLCRSLWYEVNENILPSFSLCKPSSTRWLSLEEGAVGGYDAICLATACAASSNPSYFNWLENKISHRIYRFKISSVTLLSYDKEILSLLQFSVLPSALNFASLYQTSCTCATFNPQSVVICTTINIALIMILYPSIISIRIFWRRPLQWYGLKHSTMKRSP